MADPDKLARQIAAEQRRKVAESAAREVAAKQAAAAALRAEVVELARSVQACLKAQDFPGMRPIVLTKYIAWSGRTKRKDVAAWQVVSFQRDWKDTQVTTTVWLLADGTFAVHTGISGGTYRGTVDDPFLSQFLERVRRGLFDLAQRYGCQ